MSEQTVTYRCSHWVPKLPLSVITVAIGAVFIFSFATTVFAVGTDITSEGMNVATERGEGRLTFSITPSFEQIRQSIRLKLMRRRGSPGSTNRMFEQKAVVYPITEKAQSAFASDTLFSLVSSIESDSIDLAREAYRVLRLVADKYPSTRRKLGWIVTDTIGSEVERSNVLEYSWLAQDSVVWQRSLITMVDERKTIGTDVRVKRNAGSLTIGWSPRWTESTAHYRVTLRLPGNELLIDSTLLLSSLIGTDTTWRWLARFQRSDSLALRCQIDRVDVFGSTHSIGAVDVPPGRIPDVLPGFNPRFQYAFRGDTLDLTWSLPKNVRSLPLRLVDLSSGSPIQVARNLQGASSYPVTRLPESGEAWILALGLQRVSGVEIFSQPLTIRQRDRKPPQAPALVIASATNLAVLLRWQRSASADVAGYEVSRYEHAKGLLSWQSRPIIDSSTIDTFALIGGTTYRYRVRSFDSSGNRSVWTNPVDVTINRVGQPLPPLVYGSRSGDRAIVIEWEPRIDFVLSGYFVNRSEDTVTAPLTLNDIPLPRTQNRYRDTNTVKNSTYFYEIVSVDTTGTISEPSPRIEAMSIDIQEPISPELKSIQVQGSMVRTTWKWVGRPPTEFSVAVERSRDNMAFVQVSPMLSTSTLFFEDVVGPEPDTFYYRLRVRNQQGIWSQPSQSLPVSVGR